MYSKDLIYKAEEFVPLVTMEKYKIYNWMKLCWDCINNINGDGEHKDDGDNDNDDDNSNSSDNSSNQRLYELSADFGEDHVPYRDPSAPFGPGPRINEQNIFFLFFKFL